MTLEKEYKFKWESCEDGSIHLVPASLQDAKELIAHKRKYGKDLPDIIDVWLPTQSQVEPNRAKYLSKVHKLLRIMAAHEGYTFAEYKANFKKEIGMESFSDSFNEELSLVIAFLIKKANTQLGIYID